MRVHVAALNVAMAFPLLSCGGAGPGSADDDPPAPIAEASVEWLGTAPAPGSTLEFLTGSNRNVVTQLRCSVPDAYRGEVVSCWAMLSVDGEHDVGQGSARVLTGGGSQLVSAEAGLPEDAGIRQTNFILLREDVSARGHPNLRMELVRPIAAPQPPARVSTAARPSSAPAPSSTRRTAAASASVVNGFCRQ